MHRHLFSIGLACAALAAPGAVRAQSQGAWRTYIRPYDHVGLTVEGDSVWCATAEAGLLLYHRSTATITTTVREPNGLASNALTALAVDHAGRLWAGTATSGVSLLSPDRTTWGLLNAFDGLPSEAIRVLEVDPMRDSVWIGTAAGVALWNGQEIAGTLPDGVNPSPFLSDEITGIVALRDSQFIATTNGVYVRRPLGGGAAVNPINTGLPSSVIDGLVSNGLDVFALVSGNVWRFDAPTAAWVSPSSIGTVLRIHQDSGMVLASSNFGLYRWNGTAWTLVDGTLVSGTSRGGIFSVAHDAATGEYFAANVGGVYVIPAGGGAPARTLFDSPPGNNVTNVAVQSPRVYVATTSEGFGRFDGQVWRNWFVTTCQAGCDTTFLRPEFTFALTVDPQGRKWVGCWETAMEIFDDSASPPQFTRPTYNDSHTIQEHSRAAASAVDSLGGHWFGMDTPSFGDIPAIGLDYYDSTGVFVRNFEPGITPGMRGNGKIKALTVDRNNRVWVGHTGEGLQWFSAALVDTMPNFQDVGGSQNLDVRGLIASGDTIWASTTTDLRNYNSINFTLRAFYPIPGPPGNLALNPIAVGADGRVWLASTNGIRVYNRDGSTFADYTTANSPLADNEVRSVSVDPVSGAVWIGTAAGLNRFDPFYVPPPPPAVPSLAVRTYPNPARLSGIGTTIRLEGNATSYVGRIYDIGGRLLKRFSGAPNGAVIWNGRDEDGAIVRPGVYFLLVQAGGSQSVTRMVLLR